MSPELLIVVILVVSLSGIFWIAQKLDQRTYRQKSQPVTRNNRYLPFILVGVVFVFLIGFTWVNVRFGVETVRNFLTYGAMLLGTVLWFWFLRWIWQRIKGKS